MSSTSLMNGPIWNMVKASLPKGASDSEIWKKTDQVLKEHNMSWASARKDQTTDGKAAPREQIYQELLGKKSSNKDKASQTGDSKTKSEGFNNVSTVNWGNYATNNPPAYNWNYYAANTTSTPFWGTVNANSLGGYVNQLAYQQQQLGTPSYTGFDFYLSGQGANSANSGQLASRTGQNISAMVGRSFLPQYQYTDAQVRNWLT
jgi:hypothetical protein